MFAMVQKRYTNIEFSQGLLMKSISCGIPAPNNASELAIVATLAPEVPHTMRQMRTNVATMVSNHVQEIEFLDLRMNTHVIALATL